MTFYLPVDVAKLSSHSRHVCASLHFMLVVRRPDDVPVHGETLFKLLQPVENLGPKLVVLELRLLNLVKDTQSFRMIVESIVAIGCLKHIQSYELF